MTGGSEGALFVPAMALVVLSILTLSMIAPSRRQPWRAVLASLTATLALIFILWRLRGVALSWASGEDSACLDWSSAIDVIGLLDFLVFVLLMSRFRDRRPDARRHALALAAADPSSLPDVDVWIATLDEEWPILEKALIGALNLDWPPDKLHVYVLDDGRRDWLAANCAEFGVGYLTRPDNRDRKAGNHNNALARTSSPFILSIDADFIAFPPAIRHLIGFFAEPDVAIVQSPQAFYNPDPFRNNLLLHRALPDDLDLFYKVMQPGRDAWNAAHYCGTSAMLRRAALTGVGGFATQGDIEDQILTMKLLQSGWRTIFLGEQLSVGLAPESLSALHDQRNRWCRGSLQILFTPHGPLGRGFTLVQRLLFSQSYWVLGSLIPLWYAVLPALVWLFGPRLFAHAPPDQIIAMPVLLLTGIWAALLWLGERCWLPVISPALQLFMAIELAPTAVLSLIKPFGEPLVKIHPATMKGSSAVRRRVDWLSFTVLLAIILGTLVSILLASYGPRPDLKDPAEMLTALAWTILDLVTCTIALLICFELPYQRREQRVPVRDAALIAAGGRSIQGSLRNLSVSGASIWIENGGSDEHDDDGAPLSVGETLTLTLPGLPPLPARVARAGTGGRHLGLAFAELDAFSRRRLTERVYLGPEYPADSVTVRVIPLLRGLLQRFLRADF